MVTINKRDKNPTAINILKLQRYNFKFFSLQEVVFFEYIIVKGRSFGFKQFYHSHSSIQAETGIKRSKFYSIIKRFKQLGIIDFEIKGMPKVHHFRVDFQKIIELLPKIFSSAENGKLNADFYKLLVDFFKPLAEMYQQKNIIQNNQKEYLKENREEDSDWDSSRSIIFNFLSSLSYEKKIPEKNLLVQEPDLFRACQHYGSEEILLRIGEYFSKHPHDGSMKKFLTYDKLNPSKLVFIETQLAAESQLYEGVLQTLDNLYSQRREMGSNKKKKYTKSPLVVNDNIKKMLAEAIKAKTQIAIENAFIAYTDDVINKIIQPNKFLPYFFAKQYGEYSVIETYLEKFNLNYCINSN